MNLKGVKVITNASLLASMARRSILEMTSRAKASHVGSCLSVVDILAVLYSTDEALGMDLMTHDSKDKFILSKGHAAAALYSILAIQGLIPQEWLQEYCRNGGQLGGHVTSRGVQAIELSTGSLGHGLPYAVGIAKGKKLLGENGRCIVVMSDGECDEGTTWESALLANHHRLDNLCVIIDRNRLQSLKSTEETLGLEPLGAKWSNFGWEVREVDGHNYGEISQALRISSSPICIIANTVKGKGINFMENSILWHYRSPNADELQNALNQIEVPN
jgi:transketolase